MNPVLAKLLRPVPGQPLSLGMGISLGLHMGLATMAACWSFAPMAPPDRPEIIQNVKLVELPPPKPIPPPPRVEQPPPPPPPQPQPRMPSRVHDRPPSTTKPSPVFSAAQEKPAAASGPSVTAMGEAIGASVPPAAPAGGGPLPLGKEEVPPPAVDLGPYMHVVWQRIERQKRYPSLARSRQVEGDVTLRFLLSPQGRIAALKVLRSSGADELDQAALQAVKTAAPFPPPPGAADDFWMEVTVKFELAWGGR